MARFDLTDAEWSIISPLLPGTEGKKDGRPRPDDRKDNRFNRLAKHASWLNMVEIEIGVLRGQCLDRRIDDPKRLRREIAAWERQRNTARARIKWMFTTDKARAKMGHAYSDTPKKS